MKYTVKLIAVTTALLVTSCGPGSGNIVSSPAPITGQPASTLPTKNITYANGQQLDLFVPSKVSRRTALVFVHGGGFTQGDKKDLVGHAKLLSDGGFITASINYRLAPKSSAPAAESDVTAAQRWIKDGGGGRGLEVDKVILVGYSAGGTLAMMAGLNHKNEVAAVISAAGVSDIALLSSTTNQARLKQDLADYIKNSNADAASPIKQNLRGSPPMFLIHGDKDNLVPVAQSVAMAQNLKAAGGNVLLKIVPGVGHEVLLPNPEFAEIMRDIAKYAVAVDEQK